MLCQGITGKKVPCQNRVSNNNKYCYCHISQGNNNSNNKPIVRTRVHPVTSNNDVNKPIIPVISNKPNNNSNSNNNNNSNNDRNCSICLCEVGDEEDCGLICGHLHHVDCIKQVYK